MWNHAPDFDGLPLHADGVITVHESVNSVQIAPRGKAPEKARAFLVAYRTPAGTTCVIAYLYYHENRHQEVYVPSGLPPQSAVEELLDEGIQFLESIGFMMNDMHYADKSGQQRASLGSELPFLWDRLDRYAEMHEKRLQGGGPESQDRGAFGRKPSHTTGQFQTAVRPQAGTPGTRESRPDNAKLARLLASF